MKRISSHLNSKARQRSSPGVNHNLIPSQFGPKLAEFILKRIAFTAITFYLIHMKKPLLTILSALLTTHFLSAHASGHEGSTSETILHFLSDSFHLVSLLGLSTIAVVVLVCAKASRKRSRDN